LYDLPKSLDETYSRALLGIDEEKQEYAQRLFRCLTVSIRPLRVEELAEILAVRFNEAAPPTFNADWRPLDASEAVLSACTSLIAIVNVAGSQIVQFAHFSVKEFLISERLANSDTPLSTYHILPEPAHVTFARACLSILLELDDKIDRNTISHLPLAPYSAQYWIDHSQFKNASSHVQEEMERLFDPMKPHFVAWVWLYDIDRHWLEPMSETHPTRPPAVPLYYASLCGFRGLVEHFVVTCPQDINTRGGYYDTPLRAASAKGHLEITNLLLDSNADPNLSDDEGLSSLHSASQYGHVEVVKILVDHGTNLNQKADNGMTPLYLASSYGKLEAAHFLIHCGAVVDIRNASGETPLYQAAATGNFELVRLLLDFGAGVNATDIHISTPLHRAAYMGHHDIAELLLGSGASLNAQNKVQDTPLSLACHRGRLEVSQLLLDRGSNVGSRDKLGVTPLHIASQSGYLDLVRLLLHHGADANVHDSTQSTPLHYASITGHLEIAKLLFEHGANVDSRNCKLRTPLTIASFHGHLEIARFLIEHGADVSSRDDEGQTPFRSASEGGHLHVVKFLRDCGVGDDIRNKNGQASLFMHLPAGSSMSCVS
jgi:ankyrin repeat protein